MNVRGLIDMAAACLAGGKGPPANVESDPACDRRLAGQGVAGPCCSEPIATEQRGSFTAVTERNGA